MPKGVYDRSKSAAFQAHIKNLAEFNKGRHNSIETRNRKRLARLGSLNPMFGRSRTPEEKLKISFALRSNGSHRGERNSNWRGGVSKLAHTVRTHPEYESWRRFIMERDNYTCQICQKRGGDLEVDHYPKTFKDIMNEFSIKSIEDALACEVLWDKESNRTLCVSCHRGG